VTWGFRIRKMRAYVIPIAAPTGEFEKVENSPAVVPQSSRQRILIKLIINIDRYLGIRWATISDEATRMTWEIALFVW
jgi:hypothetical protein